MYINEQGATQSMPFCATNEYFTNGYCQKCPIGNGTIYFQQPTCMPCYDMPYYDISSNGTNFKSPQPNGLNYQTKIAYDLCTNPLLSCNLSACECANGRNASICFPPPPKGEDGPAGGSRFNITEPTGVWYYSFFPNIMMGSSLVVMFYYFYQGYAIGSSSGTSFYKFYLVKPILYWQINTFLTLILNYGTKGAYAGRLSGPDAGFKGTVGRALFYPILTLGLVGFTYTQYTTASSCDTSTPTCSGATDTFGGVTDPYLAMAGLLGLASLGQLIFYFMNGASIKAFYTKWQQATLEYDVVTVTPAYYKQLSEDLSLLLARDDEEFDEEDIMPVF